MAESQVATQETPPMSREDLETLAKNETDDDGLILGKFKSVEDLAASYKELEGKLGQKEEAPESSTEEKTEETKAEETTEFNAVEAYGENIAGILDEAGIDAADLNNRFAESGELSEEDYSKLESKGLPKSLVDTYVAGLQAQNNQTTQSTEGLIKEIKDSVGGDAEYSKMRTWAQQNLSATEFDDFNSLFDEGTKPSNIKWGVQGLYSQYKNAMGTEPALVTGKSGQSGPAPFRSSDEVKIAMKDPRYGKDVTYTENVYARLADSNVFNTKG